MLGLLSGILLIISFYCYRFAWVSLVPLFLAIYWYKRDNFFYGLLAGLVYFTFYTFWLFNWDTNAALIVILSASLFMGFFAFLSSYFNNFYVYPILYLSLVYLLSFSPIGSFWAFPGIVQSQYSMQILSIFGMSALLFLILLVNSLIAKYIATKNLNMIVFAVLIILCNMLFGYFMVEDVSTDLTLAIVQPNLPQPDEWRWENPDIIFSTYKNLSIRALAEEPKILVFPQYTLPAGPDMYPMKISELAQIMDSYIIMGTYRDLENIAPVFAPDGEIIGEYTASNLPPFREQKEGMHSYKVFDTVYGNFSIMLCFDDTSPLVAKNMVQNGASFLLNLMNEGDFKDTILPKLHLSRTIVRAIENRRFIVRVTDTGLSAVADPYGRLTELIDNDVSESRTVKVKKMHTTTFFNRFGDIFSPVILALGVFIIVGRFIVKKKRFFGGL